MDNIIVILLVVAAVKFVLIGGILFAVFRDDVMDMVRRRHEPKPPPLPCCVYCQSVYIDPIDEGQTRWENDELVLVTTYQCRHCHLPFWHVERVPAGSLKR